MPVLARLACAVLAAFALTTQLAEATSFAFSNRADFEAAILGVPRVVEGWEAYPTGFVIANGSTLNGITYAFSSGEGRVADNYIPLSSPHSLAKTGTPDIDDFFAGGESVGFFFATPILAFGININTFATADGAYSIAAWSGADVVGFAASGYDPFPGTSTGQFVGLIADTPFNFVGFGSAALPYTLDDLTYITEPVPEPASLLLMGAALSGLAAFRPRRRH